MKNRRSPADVRNQAAGSSGVVGSVVGAGVGSVFGVDSVVVVSDGVEEPDDVVVVEPLDVADEVVEPEPELQEVSAMVPTIARAIRLANLRFIGIPPKF